MLCCYTEQEQRAKKAHKCSLCGREIAPGEKYIIYKGKDTEYGWFNEKYHLICQRMIKDYLDEENEDAYCEDAVDEYLHEKNCYGCDSYNPEMEDWDCDHLGSPMNCPIIRKDYAKCLK